MNRTYRIAANVIGAIALAGLACIVVGVVHAAPGWETRVAANVCDGQFEGCGKWISTLRSQGRNMDGAGDRCCDDADAQDVLWHSENGNYVVEVEGKEYSVPNTALVIAPNKTGKALLWVEYSWSMATLPAVRSIEQIRCFLPGAAY